MTAIIASSVTAAQILLSLAMACATFRILRGPRAQDRVVGFDSLYVNAMLLLLAFGIGSGSSLYFEAALIIPRRHPHDPGAGRRFRRRRAHHRPRPRGRRRRGQGHSRRLNPRPLLGSPVR